MKKWIDRKRTVLQILKDKQILDDFEKFVKKNIKEYTDEIFQAVRKGIYCEKKSKSK